MTLHSIPDRPTAPDREPYADESSASRRLARSPANTLQGIGRDQFFALSERHDPVAHSRDLSAPEERFRAEFRPDRADYAHLPTHRFGIAALHWHVHGSTSAAARALD